MKKVLCVFSIIIALGFSITPTIALAVSQDFSLTYQFLNDKSANAGGTITLYGDDGDYSLFWGDGNDKLKYTYQSENLREVEYSKFCQITVSDGVGKYNVYDYTLIPEKATSLLVYNDNSKLKYKYDIPQNKIFNLGQKKYTFGALSDVHFNRYNELGNGDDSVIMFNNSLDFLENIDVSFVAIAGDIVGEAYANQYIDSLNKYKSAIQNRKIPVYTSAGNHDATQYGFTSFYLKQWTEKVNCDIYEKDAKSRGIVDLSKNKLDFVYKPKKEVDDVVVFLSVSYNSQSSAVQKNQIDWLEKILNKYNDRNVFLFFHPFFANDEGGIDKGVGSVTGPNGYYYNWSWNANASDQIEMRELLSGRDNVIAFSGHSHWAYATQRYQQNVNVGKYKDLPTMVHISSVSSPREVYENTPKNERVELNGFASEGYVTEVYENGLVLLGTDFLNGNYLSTYSYLISYGKSSVNVFNWTIFWVVLGGCVIVLSSFIGYIIYKKRRKKII